MNLKRLRSRQWAARIALCMLPLGVTRLAAQPADPTTLGPPAYGRSASSADARFGAELGAGTQWESQVSPLGSGTANLSFGGGLRLGCSGLDFNGFLHSFDPAEILAEIRNALLNGSQAAASNYLITLAYASPTLASVLDMMDKKYTARFSAFAQTCDAQSARARGQDQGARALAQAGDQCYDRELARGTAPSEAYRRCSILHSFDGLDLPAAASTADFLRKYTHINVTREVEALLGLLPDERVDGGAYQYQAPKTTLATMSDRLRQKTRMALDRLDAGVLSSTIATCNADDILGPSISMEGCLPAGAAPLVTSEAFRSSRLLGSAARALFNDALSAQVAIGSMYSNLLELFQQTAKIDVRPEAGADAAHALSRRRQMRESIADLLGEADTQVKVQAARSQLVRMEMMALEQVESQLNAQSRRSQADARLPQFGMRNFLEFLSGSN